MTLSKIQLVSLVALVTACSAAPEDGPEYEDTGSGSSDTGDGPDINFYQGSEPFTEGMERLSIGIFYEGEASQTIEIDDLTNGEAQKSYGEARRTPRSRRAPS